MKKDSKITTIIGKGSVLEGNFSATGSVRLDGTVEGNVKVTGQFVLGAAGKVLGNIEAGSAVIGGEVLGNVIAPQKTELASAARVIGDIRTQAIIIDEKAVFQGKCDMNQDEEKARKRSYKEGRTGRKSAKEALKEALQEVKAETEQSEDVAAAKVIDDKEEA
ncbi:MAG TPA: polymer-forming cytoskeletal protein [Lachnospiraceae bacterium]|nr:polymer-forming cytoskeletal protein [Lachnospiraceae bacterium]